MKYYILFITISLFSISLNAQNVGINGDGSSPDASAILDVKATDGGILIPRMTMVERDAISSPATSLMVYQTDNTPGYYYYDGSSWIALGGAKWLNELGDAKTNVGNNLFLGTSSGLSYASGSFNVGIGFGSLASIVTSSRNTAVGVNAATSSTGSDNVLMGYNVHPSSNSASKELNIGSAIFASNLYTSSPHVGINQQTPDPSSILELSSTTSGLLIPRMSMVQRDAIVSPEVSLLIYQHDNNIGFYYKGNFGWELLGGASRIDELSDGKSDGVKNVFLGTGAGINNVQSGPWAGQYNVGIGIDALKQGVNASKSIAIGYKALYNDNTTRNTAIGYLALETVATGSGNTAIGPEVLKLTTGNNNTAVGEFGFNALVVGNENTSLGSSSGSALTAGVGNIFVGSSAGSSQTIGDKNIAIGIGVNLANLTGDNQMNIGNLIYANSLYTSSGKIGIGNGNNTPKSTLDIDGSLSMAYASGGIVTLDATHYTYNCTSAGQTITLPTAIGVTGRIYIVKLTVAGSSVVSTTVGQTIDGAASYDLTAQWKYVQVQSDGANWIIIGQN